jgi:hypothetical protein
MITRRSAPCVVLVSRSVSHSHSHSHSLARSLALSLGLPLSLSLSLLACGGAIGDGATASADAGPAPSTDGGLATATDAAPADAATKAATRPLPTAGVVWMHAEAAGFDPRACSDPNVDTDFVALSSYLAAQAKNAGLKGATVSAGGGTCAFGSRPTTLSETDVYAGTAAAALALSATPPAPFRGTYITAPIVVKLAVSVKFEMFVGDGTAHAFDDVWVHDGLAFDDEAAFLSDICTKKPAFDAAIASSPVGAAVKAWLGGKSADTGYRLGYDATFSFEDGTNLRIPDAHEAAGGPYLVPCPNLVASP